MVHPSHQPVTAGSEQIRQAKPSDAKALIGFRQRLHRETPFLTADASEIAMRWLPLQRLLADAQRDEFSLYLVALLGNDIVGELQLRRSSYRRTQHDLRLFIGVVSQVQGRGIGRAMLESGIVWARAQPDVHRVSLTVHSPNERAIKLYTSCGFVEEGRRRGAFGPKSSGDGWSDEILMALHLANAAGRHGT